MLSSGLSWRAFCYLLTPAIVHAVLHVLQVLLCHSPDEEDLDVVFDGGKFRVVDTGFGREFLVLSIDFESYRLVPKLWFTPQ